MFWLAAVVALLSVTYLRLAMSALTDLQAAVGKLQADVAAKLTAKDTQIADLTAQLAAAQALANDGPALVDLTAQVTAIDATVA